MNRNRVVKVRVTEAEYSDWTQMALRGHVSLSETIRRAMQGNTPPESPKPLGSLPVAYIPNVYGSATTANTTITYTKLGTGRRRRDCPHGKPGFAYCPECDS